MKLIIVGGVAGGATAAAKARRENESAEITIYERGQFISFANCGLPYYIGGEIHDRNNLLIMTPERFWDRYRVRALVQHEVIAIDRAKKTVQVRDDKGIVSETSYDKLILSQGAMPIVPPFKGATLPHIFTLRDIPDMDRIHQFITTHKRKTAAIIGGGFIGLEMAEALMHHNIAVTVVEKAPHILPLLDDDMAAPLTDALRKLGLTILAGIGAKEFTARDVLLEDGSRILADLVILSVGVRPEVALAREAGLVIGTTGGVVTNDAMQTSDCNIYAVGDAAETTHVVTGARTRIALAGPANRQGRVAGANAVGRKLRYRGAMGTAIVRVVSQVVGTTGLNSQQARDAGLDVFTSMTRDFSHASYYPGAKMLVTKLIAENKTGRLLGAQVLGEADVDKRIDILATAIAGKMSVVDLESLDLAYAPPFGSANDPVNVAGFVASHELHHDIPIVDPESFKPGNAVLVDVREPEELDAFGKLENAINIPLHQLRDRLGELPQDRPVIVYCQKGQRGYIGTRILQHNGFTQAANLKGGFLQARAAGCVIQSVTSHHT